MTRGKVHQDRHVEIGDEIEKKFLELIFLRSVEGQLTEHDARDPLEQARGAQVDESLVDDGHRIARLLDEQDGAIHLDLIWGADRLLDERKISANESTHGA